MYALIHNSRLLLGPIGWNHRMINFDLEEELELDYRVTPNDWQSVPIEVNEETHILTAKQVIPPDYDPKYQSIGNFTWEQEYSDLTGLYSTDQSSFSSAIEISDITVVQYGNLLATISSLKVNTGFKVTIKNLQFQTSNGIVSFEDRQYIVSSINEDGTILLIPHNYPIEEYTSLVNDSTYIQGSYVQNEVILSSAIFTYAIHEKTLEEVKNIRKQEIAPIRRQRENQIALFDVDGTIVEVLTSREERLLLSSKLSSLSTTETCNYKFKNTWLEISSNRLQSMLTEIDKIVQGEFDWEFQKNAEIDACETIDQVYEVEISQSLNNSPQTVQI